VLALSFSVARYFVSYAYIYPGKYGAYFYHLNQTVISFLKEKEAAYDLIYVSDNFPDAIFWWLFIISLIRNFIRIMSKGLSPIVLAFPILISWASISSATCHFRMSGACTHRKNSLCDAAF